MNVPNFRFSVHIILTLDALAVGYLTLTIATIKVICMSLPTTVIAHSVTLKNLWSSGT